MKKLTRLFTFIILLSTALFALQYANNDAEIDFYKGKYNRIIRYAPLSFDNRAQDQNLSEKLQHIIEKIKKEKANPHASVAVSLVGYSQHRKTKEAALTASKRYVQRVYEFLLKNGIEAQNIYRYYEGDKAMLYSDETPDSAALSNRVNINLYISYLQDNDNDGVYSDRDKCPNTPPNSIVDVNGCSAKNIVVLVEGQKKNTAIVISNKAGSVTIDKFNELTLLRANNIPPSKPQEISPQKLQKVFPTLVSIDIVNKHYTFYFDNINLLENSKKALNQMLIEIGKIKDPVIQIIGHTDTVGSSKYNYQLGLQRADEIKKFIERSKVKVLNIDAVSYGENNLAVPTADNVDEKRNRRVEVFIH